MPAPKPYLDQVSAGSQEQGRVAARMNLHSERSFEFGLERALDGIEVFIDRSRGGERLQV